MLVVGTFEHSIELEEALAVLEHEGIERKHILVVPMDTDFNPSISYIGKSRDRYYKGVEVGMACATAGAVIGMSGGFILAWGPILWSLIVAFAGFALGIGIYLILNKETGRHLPKKLPEVTVIVQCLENQSRQVMETMWEYRVLTVGRVSEPS